MKFNLNSLNLAAGFLLILFSVIHYFQGYPELKQIIIQENATPKLSHILKLIWVFSSTTMLLCGLWALSIYRQISLFNFSVKKDGFILGLGLLLFGIYQLLNPFHDFHLFQFVVPGILLLIASLFLKDESNKV